MPVAIGCERDRDAEGRTGEQFLMELFEHEYCGDCGGDHWEHIAFHDGFGNWQAMCLRIDPEEGPTPMQEANLTSVPPGAEGLVHCQNLQCEAAWSPNIPSAPTLPRARELRECPLCGGADLELRLAGFDGPEIIRVRPLVHEGPRAVEL